MSLWLLMLLHEVALGVSCGANRSGGRAHSQCTRDSPAVLCSRSQVRT